VLDSIIISSVTIPVLLLCTAVSLILGCVIAAVFTVRNRYSKGFLLTLILLPAIVQAVILLVNGNLGAGVAVAGTFSLVRFRSMPGTAREICALFQTMMVGLATGMGYIGIAIIMTLVLSVVQLVFVLLPAVERTEHEKSLRVTIPENMDYSGVFDDLFDEYTTRHELVKVKTTGMGSLYELRYLIMLKDPAREKEFLDALRCRNGNLTISCGRVTKAAETL
jgi:uncharacterized membrane protein YhiD involved in acid resistance